MLPSRWFALGLCAVAAAQFRSCEAPPLPRPQDAKRRLKLPSARWSAGVAKRPRCPGGVADDLSIRGKGKPMSIVWSTSRRVSVMAAVGLRCGA
jgi:hypothetical protein